MITNLPFWRLLTVAALLSLFLNGCSQESDGRQAISGTVNVDGTPVKAGSISFQPAEGQATASGAVITSGKYSLAKEDGLLPGTYRVAISAPMAGTVDAAAPALPGEAPPLAKDLIPPEWNNASRHTIEVKKTGAQTFPFEISTNGGAKSK